MSNRKTRIELSLPILLGVAAATAPVLAAAKSPPHIKPKISLAQARAIAIKVYPGKIMQEELEHEHGGSGLRYSFDIRLGNKWHEVGIDAMSGHVLENSREGANPKD